MLPPEIGQNLALIYSTWIAHRKPHQKAIELRLRERKCAFVFNGILGRQYKKRARQITRDAIHRHLLFLHRLQESRLGTWRGAVDLICQEDIDEDGTGLELELTALLIEDGNSCDIVRQQVGRALNSFE